MMNWIKKQFSLLWDFYRREFLGSVKITALAFVLIMVLSFLASLFFKDMAVRILQAFLSSIQESGLVDADGTVSMWGIFGNNVRATLLTILLGFIPYLYLPAFSLGSNAGLLGVFAAYYVNSGHSLLAYFAGILPHGIFELPALILAMSVGIFLCRNLVSYIRNNTKGVMKPLLLNTVRVFILNIVPLLFVASIIETYVTPAFMGLFL